MERRSSNVLFGESNLCLAIKTFCFQLQRYFVFEQESASELWITNTEWQKGGVRILREKAPFMW